MNRVATALALVLLRSTAAFAQLPATSIKHVVIVIQENRTPDNLFGADSALIQAGANLATSGLCHSTPIPLEPFELDACFDPNHQHAQGWEAMWDGGKLDGACDVRISKETCIPVAPPPAYPNYTYVNNTKYDGVNGILDPYFQIAGTCGFANYMFQTNQGPSFPAHQFLFGGTSAPDFFNDPNGQSCLDLQGNSYPCWEWFAAENPGSQASGAAGCTATSSVVPDIDPLGNEADAYQSGYSCYTHNTLTTLLEQKGVIWRYYTSPNPYLLWTAPNAISSICDPVVNGKCTGPDWTQHVVLANTGSYAGDYAPVLTDISNCALQAVSWVTPDGTWSDHPGTGSPTQPSDGGPSWVSAIVNAIGNASTCDGGAGYWADTVILITWDDWGGWFDHISPAGPAGPGIGYSNDTASEYVYGFRVPLLVVSTYAKQAYISGPSSSPSCATDHYYCHDFGSILGFVEYVTGIGSINPSYEYADFLAPDSTSSGCSHTVCPFPLADFFTSAEHPFTSISPGKYAPKCFHNPNQAGCWPNFVSEDPDNDADDD